MNGSRTSRRLALRGVISLVAVAGLVRAAAWPGRAAPIAPAEPPAIEAPLTNAEIVKLTKAGLSPDLIVMKIRQAPAESLDVSTDALIALRQQDVSDVVIAAIFERVAKRASPTASPSHAPPTPLPQPPATETAATPRGREPALFPDLEFQRADGGSTRLSQLQGKVVLMIVWATWNPPSGRELPVIQRLYDLYRNRNFDVLCVNVDSDRSRAAPFLKKLGISLPVFFPSPASADTLKSSGIPATIILGPDRSVLDRTTGFYPDWEARWTQVVEKATRP